MSLTGIDVSRHQGIIDWAAVDRSSHSFAILKATEGTSYSYDSWFKANMPRVRATDLIPGAYHFLRADRDPAAQARYYASVVENFDGMLAVVDVETAANGTKPTINHVKGFAAEFRRLVPGHPLIVYTGRWYWVGVMGDPYGADIGPLWHSEYDTGAEVDDGPELDNYGGWSKATIWQYTSSGRCPGVQGNCDLNIFYGDRAALLALARTQGDDMLTDAQITDLFDRLKRIEDRASHGHDYAKYARIKVDQILTQLGASPDIDEVALAAALLPALLPALTTAIVAELPTEMTDAVSVEDVEAAAERAVRKVAADAANPDPTG